MKKEYILLVVVIIGLGALLFYQKKDRTNYQLPILPKLEKVVDRIVLEKAGESVELRLVDGKWVVGAQKYPANRDRVTKIVDEIKGLKLTALISEKGNYQIYDLVAGKRVKASLFSAGQLLREIQIGKNSASLRQTYVILKDDPKVYQALGNLKSNLFATVSELRDKTVLKIKEEILAEIDEIVLDRLVDGKREVLKVFKPETLPVAKVEKSKTEPVSDVVWQQESGQPAAAGEISKLLKELALLECESFIADRSSEAFANPLYRVVAKGGGEFYSLSLMAAEEGKYPSLSSQSKEPFWLPAWRAEKIIKEFSVYSAVEKKSEGK